MKYFCTSEQVALYIQKYVQYRKRKVFFGATGKIADLMPAIVKHGTEKYFVPMSDVHTDEIKDLWAQSAELWFKIKETFETLKTMEAAPPCDRYEYLKMLDEADKQYRANMAKYDAFALGGEVEAGEPKDMDPAEIAKKVQAARKYISDNKKKLAEMKESDDYPNAKYDALRDKVQERFNYLIETGNSVSEDQVTELKELGIVVQ